ncbi:hypothetical protein [Sphingomonas abietis]|uniref:LTXXQ motif family protein n=1 Tax=Sphingomonas abietis TaxID=3012344 RepID=A0ABY7NN65_9SPHN|nr:hypothetical protein [Sphingomonas abietis]WBO22969.1 hypothetical protein PBT88_02160 [Sphingomonas abietis]
MRSPLLAALIASALLAGTAIAGDSPPPAPGMGSPQQAGSRADDMTLLLGLAPQQRPALEAYLQAVAPPPRGDRQDGDHGDGGDRHGPPDAAQMQARIEAAQHFRASLNPDQQARFDAIERVSHGMGSRHRWGGPPPQE